MEETVRDFVVAKLATYRIELTPVEINALLIDAGITGDPVYSTTTAHAAKVAICQAIPELLMQDNKVTEGGFSVERDKAGIREYYGILCAELGLPNKLASGQPKIRMSGRLW